MNKISSASELSASSRDSLFFWIAEKVDAGFRGFIKLTNVFALYDY